MRWHREVSSRVRPGEQLSEQARAIIQRLGLAPHPEGGWFRQIYRSTTGVETPQGLRSALTTIYYLLEQSDVSRWHLIDADEIWHFYAGSPLELLVYDPQSLQLTRHELGASARGTSSVGVVVSGHWQAARTRGAYSLVGCSVAPGFELHGFRLVSSLADHEQHFKGALARFANLL